MSPHGFGHAARASALMRAMHDLAGARFELFATTPSWFFDESVAGLYTRHEVLTDVGLHQRSALIHDIEATVAALDRLLPFRDAELDELGAKITDAGCRGVICDIAPLGIAVAQRAGLPSVLVESFLWPWLYEPFVARSPKLGEHARRMAEIFERADVHVQTEPLCERAAGATAVLPPMPRPPADTREQVRARLGVPPEAKLVVLTMGGVPESLPFLGRLKELEGVHFLVTGVERTGVDGALHLFDNATRVYMPDFMRAADAVVAKLGYSTVAEAWAEGLPLAFVSRGDFRETGPLRDWVRAKLPGFEIPGARFASGDWVERLPELLEMPRAPRPSTTGAEQAARLVLESVPQPPNPRAASSPIRPITAR